MCPHENQLEAFMSGGGHNPISSATHSATRRCTWCVCVYPACVSAHARHAYDRPRPAAASRRTGHDSCTQSRVLPSVAVWSTPHGQQFTTVTLDCKGIAPLRLASWPWIHPSSELEVRIGAAAIQVKLLTLPHVHPCPVTCLKGKPRCHPSHCPTTSLS